MCERRVRLCDVRRSLVSSHHPMPTQMASNSLKRKKKKGNMKTAHFWMDRQIVVSVAACVNVKSPIPIASATAEELHVLHTHKYIMHTHIYANWENSAEFFLLLLPAILFFFYLPMFSLNVASLPKLQSIWDYIDFCEDANRFANVFSDVM